MISAEEARQNTSQFRIDAGDGAFEGFMSDVLSPRILQSSVVGESEVAIDVRAYDKRVAGFEDRLRTELIKHGYFVNLTNYPEEVLIRW